ncbi:unnamed protein product [Prorocentrum cordatum]|uniref:Protein kinase domain-containing protein n=1 Tax=Prorocentrum cordatum TaxID=2364126 RepID=A0ABN9WGN3_9DINO|nr:unnamed protein product [Polarella glacialis]
MVAPPAERRRRAACCGRPCRRRRRARLKNGIGRLTLKFADPRKEEGFASLHKERLAHSMSYGAGVLAVEGLMSLMFHRFWDDSQYRTEEARELRKWQMLIFVVVHVAGILALGAGRFIAKQKFSSTLALEILVVSAASCFMILIGVIPKHYIARSFGHRDAEAIWGVDLGPTDGTLILYIDVVVTFVHWVMPIRWFVLAPLEVVSILAYAVPAVLLGSPATNMVPFNGLAILVLTLVAAFGKRAFEWQERQLFAGLLSEKQMRFQAEFQLSRVGSGEAAARAEDAGSERSAKLSRPGTTMSAAAFDGSVENAPLDQIRAIGLREQWLIANEEVQILPDRVLGEGGFGVVAPGLYHNTIVVVKTPRRDIAREGAISSALPELCNELRILRRIRHPNIAVLYGACMDEALSRLCLVLEFVDGVSLGAFLRGPASRGRQGPGEPRGGASEARAVANSISVMSVLIFDILHALCYLHSREPVVVHADLKDSNVFVEERHSRIGGISHRAKLLDFGLSRILTRSARPLGGTIRWMAPELFSRVPPDTAADCYSFGLLTRFIATGLLPFEDMRAVQVAKRLRGGQPPKLTWPMPANEISDACRPLVEQCTQVKPALRPSVRQASRALSMVLGHVVSGAMDAVIEQLGVRGPNGGGRRSQGQGAAMPDSADAAAKNDGLEEFLGVVEVRQTSSISVGSLVSCTGSRDLPPVQENEVLQTGEASNGAAAPPLGSHSACAQAQLTHPGYKPTPLRTQTLTLLELALKWNVSTSGRACCWLHDALDSLNTVLKQLDQRTCAVKHEGMVCGQCDNCGLLMLHDQDCCDFCDCSQAPCIVDDHAHPEQVLI